MRILYLTHRVPFPPDRGDRIRSYHTLKWLSERYDVSLACFSDEDVPQASLDRLEGLCESLYIERLSPARWLRAAGGLARGHSITESVFASRRFQTQLARWEAEHPFDAAIAFCSSMGQYFSAIQSPETRRILDLVDVDSEKWRQYAGQSSGPRRWIYELESRRVRQLEKRLTTAVDSVICVSEREAELFRSACPNDCTGAIRNGVDTDYFHPGSPTTSQEDAHRCVFVGVLDYKANIDGIEWFCNSVWPRVREQVPDATFHIVGKNPTPAVSKLAEVDGVTLVGPVPDVRPHLREAAIAIAPLRVARGIQNKVLEAMAMAKPVVATQEALDGLDVENGTNAMCGTDADRFSDCIVELMNNANLRHDIGRFARDHVVANYGWHASLSDLTSLIESSPHGDKVTFEEAMS